MRGYNSYKSGDFFIMGLTTILLNTLIISSIGEKESIAKNIIVILLMVYNIYKIYFILEYCTVKYYLDDKELIISYLWGIINVKTKMDDVLGYFERNVPSDYKMIFGYEFRTIMLGIFKHKILKKCRSYVTNKNNLLFISTKDGYVLISPEEIQDFKYKLNSLYKPEIYLDYYEFEN